MLQTGIHVEWMLKVENDQMLYFFHKEACGEKTQSDGT